MAHWAQKGSYYTATPKAKKEIFVKHVENVLTYLDYNAIESHHATLESKLEAAYERIKTLENDNRGFGHALHVITRQKGLKLSDQTYREIFSLLGS